MSDSTRLMTELEVSQRLGCSVGLLRKWRLLRKGPSYVNIGRLVRYQQSDISAFLEAHRVATGGEQ
jgi:predicted DNA-binding transcriptional regulator AlpA